METIKRKSSFINILAWTSIVFSGFGIVMGILQNILMQTVMKDNNFQDAIKESGQQLPPMMVAMFEHMDTIMMLTLILTIFIFVTSIALLKRKNWARVAFIVLLILNIVWTVVNGFMQFDMLKGMGQIEGVPPEFQQIQSVMGIVMGLMLIAMSILYLYLIKRLNSKEIKEEFLEN